MGSTPTCGSMPLTEILTVYALLAGIMAIELFTFTIFFEKDKKRGRKLLIWSVLFIAAAFAATEYAFWLEGVYLFERVIQQFNFPLLSYFVIWFAFIIWLFESRGERKIWIILAVALAILTIVAINCPNCIRF